MTQLSLGPALERGVNLLRGLARRRSAVEEARRTAAGPVPFEGGFLTGQVLERQDAVADAATLKAAGEAAFDEWLADTAREAQTTWHWL
ncbi:hypothetical protein [Nonomuraea sp. NPDC052265]|uniref:hypothetical protein n=1 Tax=Nonomuraea sp. NPDC052265 TaxID=3364374 RepID=UPI0037C58216